MTTERVHPLDQQTLELFALKGSQGPGGIPQKGNANGVKVRRVMQLIRDFSKKPFEQLQVLDLACGEGVYSIEAALRGANVRAVDARPERMNEGAKAAERLGLSNLRFEQNDIRTVTRASHGGVDVVLFLGILYHLDQQDILPTLKNLFELCTQFVIIDTHISLTAPLTVEYEGQTYEGKQIREHGDQDPDEVRRGRLLASLDNTKSFLFTKESLFRLLSAVGFTSVCECNVPLEPFKPEHRITIVAAKGETVQVSSYPWVNGKSAAEIERYLAEHGNQEPRQPQGPPKQGVKQLAKSMVNGVLRPLGLEINATKRGGKKGAG